MKTPALIAIALMLSLSLSLPVLAADWDYSGYGGSDWDYSGTGGSDWDNSGTGGTDWDNSGTGGTDWGDTTNDWDSATGTDWGSDWTGGTDTWTDDYINNGGNPPTTDWTPNPGPTQNGFNLPPVLNPIGNYVVNEGQLLTFSISGSDPEGQVLGFGASNLPTGASFNGQTFSWTPDFNQAGQYSVTFAIADIYNLQDTETVTITVLDVSLPPPPPVNHVPVFLSEPVTSAFIREWYFSQVIVFDQDGDDVSLSLATAPAGMSLSYVDTGYTVFSSWIDSGDTETEEAITGETFTVTMNSVTATACDVTINNIRRTVPYQAGLTHQITTNGVTYSFTVDPDLSFGDCHVSIIDERITSGWIMWLPEPSQAGSNAVSIHANDGQATAAQNFNISVVVDPRTLPRADEPRGPKKDIRVNTIALPEEAYAGDIVIATINFENSGDLKLDGAEATLSIPELGIRSPTIGPLDLRVNKDVSRTLVLEIPSDAQDGLYTVRLTVDSGSVHRIVHRDIEIVSG